MEIVNLSANKSNDTIEDNPFCPVHPYRILLSGPSGCGKTNVLGNLILHYLTYDKCYIYSRHVEDKNDIYVDLREHFEKINDKIHSTIPESENYSCYEMSDNFEDIISVDDLDGNIRNLIVIDDFVDEHKQGKIGTLFISGRHKNASIIYLSQSYHKTPKLIRENCNYFILFKVNNRRELQELSKTHCLDYTFDEFMELFQEATNEPFSFLVIDKKTSNPLLKYRKKFDGILTKE